MKLLGRDLLISKKELSAFTPEEFHEYVKGMYQLRVKAGVSKVPVEGLSVTRTKAGALSVRMSKTKRAFAYVLNLEIALMAEHYGVNETELREAFLARGFLVTGTRLEAEKLYETQQKFSN